MEMFIVGESNCSFQEICDILLTPDDETAISFSHIVVLTRKLVNSSSLVQQLKIDQLKGQLNYESLHCVLSNWRSKFSTRATIGYLLKTLRSLQLNLKADQLQDFFNKRRIGHNEEYMLKNYCIPPQHNYYIPRMIISRNILDPEGIFKKHEGNDIFLFSGIQRHELTEKARCPTDTSANQRHLSKLSVKYMVLSFNSDFVDISKKVNHPVHLIHHEHGNFSWVNSVKGFHTIQQAVSVSQQDCITEETFLEVANQNLSISYQPVLIADTPGMGKSYLLGNLARAVADGNRNSFIIFADFSLFISQIQSTLVEKGKLEVAITKVLTSLSHMEETAKYNPYEAAMPKGMYIEVMLDGFDEIPTEDQNQALECLKIIRTFPTTRLWVTSRPHLLNDLEKCLQVLGHYIRPFSSEDQVNFLENFWSLGDNSLDTGRLRRFALSCLELLKKSMNSTENHIAGIPLQCMLIATLHMEEAVKYARIDNIAEDINEPLFQNDSIASLFERMAAFKLNSYLQRHSISTHMYPVKQLLNAHILLSIKLLFPQFVEKFRHFLAVNPENMLDDMFEIGLVEHRSNNDGPQLLHRLFAEYFVAQFISDCIRNESNGIEIARLCEVIFESIAKTVQIDVIRHTYDLKTCNFRHLAICYFLDSMLENEINLENFHLNADAIRSCVAHNLNNLFDFIYTSTDFRHNERDVFNDNLLLTAVMFADVSLISQLSDLYNIYHKSTIRSIRYTRKKHSYFQTSNIGDKFSLLHVAVRFRNYTVVDHLVHKHSFHVYLKNSHYRCRLLQYCVHKSRFDSDVLVKEKVQTLRLLNVNTSILQIWDNLYASAFYDKIHSDLEIIVGVKMNMIRLFTRFSPLRFFSWPALRWRN